MLSIVTAPNQVLSQIAKPVAKLNKKTLQLLEEMKQTLANTSDPEGVGLAAPQVGQSLQIFVAKPTPKSPFLTFINPKIVSESTDMQELKRPRSKKSKKPGKLEGCLSLKDIWGTVQRHALVTVSFMDETGAKHEKTFSGFLAIIAQHEIDHLNGVLFPKRVLEQQGKLYKSHKNAKGEDEFDPIEI